MLRSIRGDAEVRNSYKPFRFEEIGGALAVRSEAAAVIGSGVEGNCSITTSFNEINVSGIGGRLEVQAPSTKVTASDVGGGAVIRSSFNEIDVSDIKGPLEIDAESSAIGVARVSGDLRISNSFRPVEVTGSMGSVRIESQSSSVDISEIDDFPSGGVFEITSSFRPITVVIPADAATTITAKTSHGRIISDFPSLPVDGDERWIRIQLGNGAFPVRINSNDDIIIRRK